MRIKSQKDFCSGLMFSAVGIAFAWGASTYNLGNGARMGPGYFPLVLGILLAVLGLLVSVQALGNTVKGDGEPVGAWAWKPLGCILGANVLFGVLLGGLPRLGIPPMGLVAGIYGLTLLASLASNEFKLKEVLILATLLCVLSYVAFVWLLNLQFLVWPAFITG